MTARIIVVGAGVIGLSCAVALAEAGLEVDVLARDLPAETTSALVAALWLPPPLRPASPGWPVEWADRTLTELTRAATDPDSGVRLLSGMMHHHGGGWSPTVDGVPVLDMPRYLARLRGRLLAADGTVTRTALPALPTRGIVVNCTGAAAGALARDPAVRPIRGRSVTVARPVAVGRPEADARAGTGTDARAERIGPAGADRWWADDAPGGPTIILPHPTGVVISGSFEDDATNPTEGAHRWIGRGADGRTADGRSADEGALIERAARLVPALRDVPIIGRRVGLLGDRPSVRLEAEALPTPDDAHHVRVHCYGHGIAGVTLSWGSAEAVRDIVLPLASGLGRSDGLCTGDLVSSTRSADEGP